MKKTLEKINELLERGIINKYAIAGGMGQFYYIEPSVTYDLDIIISIGYEKNKILSLDKIYKWAAEYNYKSVEEHIIIESVPVQFLPAYNELVSEALDNALSVELFGVKTFILKAEYLMAILLQTYRPKDRERLLKFLKEADYSEEIYFNILNKFNLKDKHDNFLRRYDE